jgi:glyoxylase-like metal-dependent hydrolase (beta-lactamase superfamily II)
VAFLRSADQTMLFDAGVHSQRRALRERLLELGLQPEDIQLVFLSHLHWDHALNFDFFPSARFVVNAKELESAGRTPVRDRATPPYLARLLTESAVVTSVTGGTLLPGISLLPTPGHTEGHTSLLVETAAGHVVLAGDAFPRRDVLESGVPDPIFWDPRVAGESLRLALDVADVIVPGHDEPFFRTTGGPAGRRF